MKIVPKRKFDIISLKSKTFICVGVTLGTGSVLSQNHHGLALLSFRLFGVSAVSVRCALGFLKRMFQLRSKNVIFFVFFIAIFFVFEMKLVLGATWDRE